MNEDAILTVKNLHVTFSLTEGLLNAVNGVDFAVRRGKTLGIVGESGCGKSVTAQAILRIVPQPGIVEGEMIFRSMHNSKTIDLAKLDPFGSEIRNIRGAEISMIFQEPMEAFSPVHTIGDQIMEGILLHVTTDKREAREIAVETLKRVDVPNAEQRLNEYPHQLSGGLRQRAMIAMALSCRPAVLIADEPTTALDVTVQAQVLQLIADLKVQFGMSVIFITHDMGVIAEMSDEVAVMYLGRIVEHANVDSIFYDSRHPYTRSLLASIPEAGKQAGSRLETIRGSVPVPLNLREGCGFYSRCDSAKQEICNVKDPPLVEVAKGHYVRCFHFD